VQSVTRRQYNNMVASVREQMSGSTRSTHSGPQISSFKESRQSMQDITILVDRIRLTSSPVHSKGHGIRDVQGNSVANSPSILSRRRCKGLPALLALENSTSETNFTTPSVPMAPKSGPQIVLFWDAAAQSALQTSFVDGHLPYLSPIADR
jgi:hypothetical protein